MLDSSIIFHRPSILSALLRHSEQKKKKRKTILQCISVRHLPQFLSIWVTPLRLQRSVARLGHEKPSLAERNAHFRYALVDVNKNGGRGRGRGMNFEGSDTHIVGGQFLVKSPRARLVLGGKRLRADVVPRRETEKKREEKAGQAPGSTRHPIPKGFGFHSRSRYRIISDVNSSRHISSCSPENEYRFREFGQIKKKRNCDRMPRESPRWFFHRVF